MASKQKKTRKEEEELFFSFVEGVFKAEVDAKTTLDTIYDEFQRIKKLSW